MKLYGETTTFDEDKLSEDIETKRQVFTTQPDPPYSVGDLWVQGKSGEILVCNTQRSSGSYVSSDWSKASKYTDDSGLTDWIDGDYADAIKMIGKQIDAKAETYYQANDPSLVWSEEAKPIHEGDLWYRTTDNTTWYYTGSSWTQQNIPNAVFDEIDGKARIFTTQPTPPYFVGDLWFNSASSDILTCMTAKISGQSFSKSDWVKRNKYTDNSSLDTFRNGAYADFVTATQNGIASAQETADSRITTFYQATQPTANTEGDLWIDTDDSNKLYRWNGFSWMSIRDADIQNALTAAGNAQATADRKKQTFISTPTTPYYVGDTYFVNGKLLVCHTERLTGSYTADDWSEDLGYASSDTVATLEASTKTELDTIRSEASADYTSLSDSLDKIQASFNTQVEQTSEDFSIRINGLLESLTSLANDTSTKFAEYSKYFRFTADGLEIGEESNALTLVLDNDKISFRRNGVEFSYWDGSDNSFHVGDIIVDVNQVARFGSFGLVPLEGGDLAWKWLGGST